MNGATRSNWKADRERAACEQPRPPSCRGESGPPTAVPQASAGDQRLRWRRPEAPSSAAYEQTDADSRGPRGSPWWRRRSGGSGSRFVTSGPGAQISFLRQTRTSELSARAFTSERIPTTQQPRLHPRLTGSGPSLCIAPRRRAGRSWLLGRRNPFGSERSCAQFRCSRLTQERNLGTRAARDETRSRPARPSPPPRASWRTP